MLTLLDQIVCCLLQRLKAELDKKLSISELLVLQHRRFVILLDVFEPCSVFGAYCRHMSLRGQTYFAGWHCDLHLKNIAQTHIEMPFSEIYISKVLEVKIAKGPTSMQNQNIVISCNLVI